MANTPKAKAGTQRRVYVLPDELVNRILEFQVEKGIPSETEAARRLLDDALKSRDSYRTITQRFLDRLKELRIYSEVAREVLAGHPLVENITFQDDMISFRLKDGMNVTISDFGVRVEDRDGRDIEWPEPRPKKKPAADIDDDIPF
jgi:hypothetical protein